MNDCQRPVTPFGFEAHQARMNEAYQKIVVAITIHVSRAR